MTSQNEKTSRKNFTSPVATKSLNGSKPRAYCRICGGFGYAIKSLIVPEYDPVVPVGIGEPCPICKGSANLKDPGFPRTFSEADMTKFDFTAYGRDDKANFVRQVSGKFWTDFPKWEDNNKGLYIWSKTKGSGKTFLACCLGGSIQLKHRKTVKFVSAVEYLQAVKETFKQGPEVPSKVYGYTNCDLLILDDLGSEKASEWADQELFHLIDSRMSAGKPLIITSNMPVEELKCDGRISDRLMAICIAIAMPEVSIRRKKAEVQNTKFLRELFGA